MQTPILYRLRRGNSIRIGRFFAVVAFAVFSIVGALIPAGNALAASYIPNGTKYTWVNEAKIEATVFFKATFTDPNPKDLDRTFKTTVSQGLADSYKRNCTNYNGDPANLYYLIPISRSQATLYEVEKRDSPGECKMLSKTINLHEGEKAIVLAGEPCPAPQGPVAPGSPADLACQSNAEWIVECPGFSSPFPPLGHICTPTTPPGVAPPAGGGTNGPTNGDGNAPDPCDSLGDFTFRWIACPLLKAGTEAAKAMDSLIESQLHYDTAIFDRTSEGGEGFYRAWSTFRSIALALVLIVGLIMVVSQGTGMQLFDAYTIRKVMPRLLIAVIGITLSWPILQFVITLFNDLGHGLQDLILLPFQSAAKTTEEEFAGSTAIGSVLSIALAGAGAYAYIATMGPLALMTLLGTALLALLVAVLVILIRSVVITATILFAPLAIACYILPNTKKVWDFWQNALVTALMIFPIIMLLIGAGKAMSFISENGIMKVLFLLAPYFFLPFAFKLAGGLMSTIFSLANDRGRGGFDRLRNIRENERKKRVQDAIENRGNTMMNRGLGRVIGSAYRRAHLAGQPGGGAFGAKYQASKEKLYAGVTAKMLEDDHGRAAGDDDATALALQSGMTQSKFLEQYKARTGADDARAMHALRTLESGFGAKLGSDAMRVTAFKALASSTTGYKPDPDGGGPAYEAMTRDAVSMVESGYMNAADAAAALKANKARADISGVGFGKWITTIAEGQQRMRAGASTLVADPESLAADALIGSQPGQLVGGRHEAVTALAPAMFKRLNDAHNKWKQTGSTTDEQAFKLELAAVAGRYDVMGQISQKSAGELQKFLTSKGLDGEVESVWQMVEGHRNDPTFRTARREYGAAEGMAATQWQQQQMMAQSMQQGGPGGGIPPVAGVPPR